MAYSPFVAPGGQDLRPNVFSMVGGGTLNQVVVSLYDLYKPNELVQVFERHTHGKGFRLMLKAMGFNRGTSAPTTGHYEYPWRENLITVGQILTPSAGPGTNVVIELDAADHYASGVTVNGVGGQTATYPIVNEIILFRSGESAMITAKDTTTNPALHRLTLTPLQAATDLAASVVVGESYFVSNNAHAEGSGLPQGRTPRVIAYHNEFQIVKVAAASTGTELTNTMYFNPIADVAGSLYLKVKEDMMYTFEKDCDGALIWGEAIDNVSVYVPGLQHDAPIKGTEGLLSFAETNGNVDNYIAIGGYTIADFRDMARYYEQERVGASEMMCLQGYEIYQEIEQEMVDFLNADLSALMTEKMFYGDNVFDYLNDSLYESDPANFALRIGFKAIEIAGYTFMFRKFPDFNKRVGAGSTGYNYSSWQVVLPVGYATDKKSNTKRGTFGYEYKVSEDGYNREQVIGEFYGAGVGGSNSYRSASNQDDIHKCFMISEFAFHPTCGNHITIQKPV
jgi:hypothetical protein